MKTTLTALAYLCLSVLLAGCAASLISFSNVQEIRVTGSTSIPDYYCAPVSVYFYDNKGNAVSTSAVLTVQATLVGATQTETFANREDCVSGLSSSTITVPIGSSYWKAYIKSKVAQTFTVNLKETNTGLSASISLTVNRVRFLGQPDASTITSGTTPVRMNTPNQVATDGEVFAVHDSANNRVLVWRGMPSVNGQGADVVVGQPDFFTGTANTDGLSARSLHSSNWVSAVAVGNSKLVVGDPNNNRTLIWNSIPTQNYQAADLVLGQNDFTSNGNMATPTHTASDMLGGGIAAVMYSNKLAVLRNWKLIFFDVFPTTNNQAADYQFGEPNLSHPWDYEWDNDGNGVNGCCVPTEKTLRFSFGAATNGREFGVADSYNNRVLIWSAIPTSHAAPASVVLGHNNFTTYTWFDTPLTSSNFYATLGIAMTSTKLFVSDYNRNRVMVWNSIPTTNNQSADKVIGQPDFASNTANNGGASETSIKGPKGLATDGTRLFIADSDNHRILIIPFEEIP